MALMEETPTFREYAVTVLRRSMATWHGNEGWFALAAYLAVLALPFLASGAFREILGDTVNAILAYIALAWLVVLFFVITPYRMWHEQKIDIAKLENKRKPGFFIEFDEKRDVVRNADGTGRVRFRVNNPTGPRLDGVSCRVMHLSKEKGSLSHTLLSTSEDGGQFDLRTGEFKEIKLALIDHPSRNQLRIEFIHGPIKYDMGTQGVKCKVRVSTNQTSFRDMDFSIMREQPSGKIVVTGILAENVTG